MSAPDTNIEKQKRRHRGPLIGMAVVVIFALGLILFWLMDEVDNGADPEAADPAGVVIDPAVTAPPAVAPPAVTP